MFVVHIFNGNLQWLQDANCVKLASSWRLVTFLEKTTWCSQQTTRSTRAAALSAVVAPRTVTSKGPRWPEQTSCGGTGRGAGAQVKPRDGGKRKSCAWGRKQQVKKHWGQGQRGAFRAQGDLGPTRKEDVRCQTRLAGHLTFTRIRTSSSKAKQFPQVQRKSLLHVEKQSPNASL